MKLMYGYVIILLVVAGCASPINLRNAYAHADAGDAAMGRGEWALAMRQYAQAVVNADLGNAEPRFKQSVNYQYGRAMGVLCQYDDSEKYLLRSKQFSEAIGASPYLALYELGLVNEKQAKFDKAANYYAELLPLMEQAGLRSKYPLGAADAHERYANALKQTGRPQEAASQRDAAASIRASNPHAKPFGTVTPYGTRCSATSQVTSNQ